MTLLGIVDFLGRFHPVLVHLPIGILLMGVLLHWLSRRKQFHSIQPAVSVTLLLGVLSAILSCITGWLLGLNDEYDTTILERHRWMGIGVAVVAALYYLAYTEKFALRLKPKLLTVISVVLILLITLTGHLGGTLTHGEGFLSFDGGDGNTEEIRKVIPDVQEAMVYDDIIQPILQNKCYSCHGPSKQKGKLRLDSREAMEKGGEDGEALVAGDSKKSRLYTRLVLDILEKEHMPPKGKPQPSEAEVMLVNWWISTGAHFDQQVKTLPQEEHVKPLLLALQSDHIHDPVKPDVPKESVAKASEQTIEQLMERGATILPVAENSNYLSVSFFSANTVNNEVLQLLESLSPQLVWLKLNHTSIDDDGMKTIGKLQTLTRLNLANTSITDAGLSSLQSLSKLQYLNLTGTKVTGKGLQVLSPLPELTAIYLYQTDITTEEDWLALQQSFPKTKIDTGGYSLPILEGDTSLVRLVK